LAGGLSLYGFAAGDPVNFTDPFGLCPECLVSALASLKRPYSTGGDIAALKPEARAALFVLANRAGRNLGVSSTTGGTHSDPRHASGLAVDINEVDGVDIGTGANFNSIESMLLANDVGNAAAEMPEVRAAIWPTGHIKSDSFGDKKTPRSFAPGSALHRQHQNHLHITFYAESERPEQ
jgi:hypothetical protein